MEIEYRLATVADFLAVPEEKLTECFADFATWLRLARNAAMVEQVTGAKFSGNSFIWRDDGVTGLSGFDVSSPEGEHIGRFDFPVASN